MIVADPHLIPPPSRGRKASAARDHWLDQGLGDAGAARVADALSVAALAVVAALAAATFRDYGLGWDDYTHAQYGELLLSFYASGFADRRAFSFVNLYYYGGGSDMAAALLAKALPFDLFATRRLFGALVGLIGLAATWRLARRLGGGVAGLFALLFLAGSPVYYGEMFINSKDAPFAVAMVIALYALARALLEYPRPTPTTVVILGLGFGLAIGTRILGGFVAIYAVAGVAVVVGGDAWTGGLRTAGRRLLPFLVRIAPAIVLAYAVMALIWPWGVIDPRNPFRALSYFGVFFEKPWREIFDGVALSVHDMPRRYLPTLLALKLAELSVVLGVLGLTGSIVAMLRPGMTARRRAALAAVVLAVAFPVALTVITHPAMYNGIRHFVFLLPPLAVLAGLAAAWLIARALRAGRLALTACTAILAAGLALPVIEAARLHPYQYSYFNRFIGGVAGAQSLYMLDYWGLSFKQASEALRAVLAARGETPPAGRTWSIAVCGPHPPAQVALGEAFTPTWDPQGADFAMTLGVYYCATLDAPVLATVERAGVTYARVYDLRGRRIENLFTLPPITRDP